MEAWVNRTLINKARERKHIPGGVSTDEVRSLLCKLVRRRRSPPGWLSPLVSALGACVAVADARSRANAKIRKRERNEDDVRLGFRLCCDLTKAKEIWK